MINLFDKLEFIYMLFKFFNYELTKHQQNTITSNWAITTLANIDNG